MIDFDSLNYRLLPRADIVYLYNNNFWIVVLPGNIPYIMNESYIIWGKMFEAHFFKNLEFTEIDPEDRIAWTQEVKQ